MFPADRCQRHTRKRKLIRTGVICFKRQVCGRGVFFRQQSANEHSRAALWRLCCGMRKLARRSSKQGRPSIAIRQGGCLGRGSRETWATGTHKTSALPLRSRGNCTIDFNGTWGSTPVCTANSSVSPGTSNAFWSNRTVRSNVSSGVRGSGADTGVGGVAGGVPHPPQQGRASVAHQDMVGSAQGGKTPAAVGSVSEACRRDRVAWTRHGERGWCVSTQSVDRPEPLLDTT